MLSHNKNLATNIILNTISYGLLYVVNLLMAKMLPPIKYGDMSIIIRSLMLISMICLMGIDLGANKFLSLYLIEHKDSWVRGYLTWAKKVLLTTTVIIILFSVSLTMSALILHKIHYIGLHRWHPLIYALYLTPLVMLSTFLGSILNASGHFFLHILPETILSYILFIIVVMIFSYTLGSVDLNLMILALGIERGLVIILQILFIIYTFPTIKNTKKRQRSWLKDTLPLMQTEFLHMGIAIINIIMVEMLATSENDVGYYSAIAIIAHSIMLFNQLFFPVLTPLIHSYLKTKKLDQLQEIIRLQNSVKLLGVLIIMSMLFVFGRNLLSHFGSEYLGSYVPLLILGLSFSIVAVTDSAKNVLLFGGGESITVKISWIQLFLTIGLNTLLIPFYGFLGATISMLLSILFTRPVLIYFAKSRIKIGLF